MRPEFVDNLELKLIDALNGHLDWLEVTYKTPLPCPSPPATSTLMALP